MKVLVIGHSLVSPECRKRWQALAQLWPQAQLTLMVPGRWEQTEFGNLKVIGPGREKKDNYEVLPVAVTHHHNWSKYRIKRQRQWLAQIRPDAIVVMQEEFTYCLLWTLIVKKWVCPKVPVIFFSWQNMEVANKKLHKKILWRWLCRETAGMIAGTEQIRNIFLQAGYFRPILTQTEIGVDPQWFYPDRLRREEMRKRWNLGDSYVVGFCGRMVIEKGVLDLVEALTQFSYPRPWKLLLVGDGSLKTEIQRRFQECSLSEHLVMTGEISMSETVDAYRAMDLFVLPSRTTAHWREQFGLVLAQAMMVNVPTIGSSSGAIPEVIGQEARIFPEGDITALSLLINKMMTDDEGDQNQHQHQHQQNLAKRYSIGVLAQEMKSFLTQLVAGH